MYILIEDFFHFMKDRKTKQEIRVQTKAVYLVLFWFLPIKIYNYNKEV